MQGMTKKLVHKLVLLGTGGTISGRSVDPADNIAYQAGQLGIEDLLATLPQRIRSAFEFVSEQIAQVDSKDMSFAIWRRLAARCIHHLSQADVCGLVITHGTDTLEETAYFLHRVLAGAGALCKPVVLTGAMRPASSMSPDGPQNLLDALLVASAPSAVGVLVVMAGKLYVGAEVQKVHCYRLDAFDATDAGPLGYVEEGAVRLVRPWPQSGAESTTGFGAYADAMQWPRVEVVMNHAGASGFAVDALIAHGQMSKEPLSGLVVAGTGNGTLHHELEAALLRATQRGISVVRSTRCPQGRVLTTGGESLPDSAGLSPVKARIALMLRLMEERATA